MHRAIGKVLRGKATPIQITLACVLASMIAFVPAFSAGPGAIITLVILLIVSNANLVIAALVGSAAKLVALAALPLSFAAGRVLLDGPAQPLFRWLVNAPVLALFGFERYAVTGGLLLGCVFGFVVAFVINGGLRRFRRLMSGLETSSERYRSIVARRPVRMALWVLVGGSHGKKSYADLLGRRGGLPIRPLGAVAAVLLIVLLFIGVRFASAPLVSWALQSGLERANGATVDLDSASLDLAAGRLVVTGLAVADASDLGRDVLRASRVEADIATADLLRRRLVLDRVELDEASSGEPRATRGRLLRPRPADDARDDVPDPRDDEGTLEDYIAKAEQWRDRLTQLRRWLEKLSPPERDVDDDDDQGSPDGPTWGETLRRRAEELGYANVTATHLIEGAPTLLVRELRAGGVRVAALEGDRLELVGRHLSTHPSLIAERPVVRARSESGKLDFRVRLPGPADRGDLRFAWTGIAADRAAAALVRPGLVQGGTMDVRLEGDWLARGVGWVDLPLVITLHDTRLDLGGAGAADVAEFTLPLGIRGPIDRPRVTIDDDALATALAAAGAERLSRELQDRAREELGAEAGDAIDRVLEGGGGDALRGLIGGDRGGG